VQHDKDGNAFSSGTKVNCYCKIRLKLPTERKEGDTTHLLQSGILVLLINYVKFMVKWLNTG